jgi:GNAT superfamily N-acetyltransferase
MYSVRKSNPKEVCQLISQISEFEDTFHPAQIDARFTEKEHQILVAHNQNTLLGFLIAHSMESNIYNLWLTGVLHEHRNQGIGTFLMNEFRAAAVKLGNYRLQVKTLNRHRAMMKLLIDLGYDVIKYESPKITFELRITEQGDPADIYGSSNLNWM